MNLRFWQAKNQKWWIIDENLMGQLERRREEKAWRKNYPKADAKFSRSNSQIHDPHCENKQCLEMFIIVHFPLFSSSKSIRGQEEYPRNFFNVLHRSGRVLINQSFASRTAQSKKKKTLSASWGFALSSTWESAGVVLVIQRRKDEQETTIEDITSEKR